MFNNATNDVAASGRHLGVGCQVVVTLFYCLGIIGNILALYTLCSREFKCNKVIVMLKYMTVNDLVALLGMSILMNLQLIYPDYAHNYWFCVLRVFWRTFGLGSGCVAIVMAIERWLALTKPFLFKQYVTSKVVNRSIYFFWLTGTTLTCLPFAGFGLYFKNNECIRYRYATEPVDIAYAYIYFAFGIMLCSCIVVCNLAVMKELARVGKRNPVRQLTRSFSHTSHVATTHSNPTCEELAFAKLMAVLCISFVICWMPQMISIPMAQFDKNNNNKFNQIFFRVADILMAIHFTLDPYVYVLLRFRKTGSSKQPDIAMQPLNNTSGNNSEKL